MIGRFPTPPAFAGRSLTVVRHPRARRLKLSIDPATGLPRLSLPKRGSLAAAFAWAESQRGWVEARLAERPAPVAIAPGTTLTVDDRALLLVHDDAARGVRREDDRLLVGGPLDLFAARVLRHLKGQALRTLADETAAMAAAAGLRAGTVSVADPRGRWGSCAADGRIRYSWRLILAPAFVRRAVVAHEVAHLRERGHGPAFHAFAESVLGESHAPATAWLRANGTGLHAVGRGDEPQGPVRPSGY